MFSEFDRILADPTEYGFINVTEPCLDALLADPVNTNPDDYVFWDSVHPTTRAHAILADRLFSELLAHPPMSQQATGNVTIAIHDVTTPPIATAAGPDLVVPGQPLTFEFSATDESAADEAAGFNYRIDWNGDGTDIDTVFGPASGIAVEHVYAITGHKHLRVTATDQDGDTGPEEDHVVNVQRAAIIDGDLYVGGTEHNDWIQFSTSATGAVRAWVNREAYGPYFLDASARLVAYGQGGNDWLVTFGVGRAVELHGGEGRDFLFGGHGADLLFGDDGNDFIHGGRGNDQIRGGDGHDFLFGQAGNDTLYGDAGNDALFGGRGDDVLFGGTGNDWLFGGTGADLLDGGDGFDWLFGLAGDVLLV
jgi:Ca2+-binding RTX toxin-like protein